MLRGIAPEVTKTNLSKIIETVLKKDIKILLTGMQAPNSYGSEYQQSFNDIYPTLAEEFQISLYPFLLEGVALIPELNQSDGKLPISRTTGTAFSPKSYLSTSVFGVKTVRNA